MNTTVNVTGMTCAHCAGTVSAGLRALPGVTAVQVQLAPGEASPVIVTSDAPLDPAAVSAAVREAGYAVAD